MPFCKRCGSYIPEDAQFCPYCGAKQPVTETPVAPSYPITPPLERKDPGLTALIAIIAGFFGLWGIGHIYIGKVARGIALLILGIVIQWFLGIIFFVGITFGVTFGPGPHEMMYGPGIFGFMLFASIIWLLIIIVGLIWQAYDAYSLAKYYNEYVQTYQRTPW